jgi:hypothetical protein
LSPQRLALSIALETSRTAGRTHRSARVVSGDLFVGDVAATTALLVDDLISFSSCVRPAPLAKPEQGELSRSSRTVCSCPAQPRSLAIRPSRHDSAVSAWHRCAARQADHSAVSAAVCRSNRPRDACSPISLYSETPIEANGIGFGNPQVASRQIRPFLRCARIRLHEVSDRKTRSQRRPMATIKQVELARDSVGEPARHLAPYVSTDPSSAEAFAFEIEESDLVERIHHPQTVVELQAIDNSHWVAKPDMLGPQVAMPVDNMAFAYPGGENVRLMREEAAQRLIDTPHKSRRQPQASVEQHATIVRQALPPMSQMPFRGNEDRNGSAVKLYKCIGELVELPSGNPPRNDRMLEHRSFIEAAHDHKPVNNRALLATDRKPMSRELKWSDVKIDIGREPPVEAQLRSAGGLALGQRGKSR